MAQKPRDKKENWLLIKGDDDFARGDKEPDILDERPESVKTGRVVEEIEGEAPGWSSKSGKIEQPASAKPAKPAVPKRARKAGFPGFIEPALASLTPAPPAAGKWPPEIKFCGYRRSATIRAPTAPPFPPPPSTLA